MNSLDRAAWKAAQHQRSMAGIDEAWSSPSGLIRRTVFMTCMISLGVTVFSFPFIGFDPYAAGVTTVGALIAAPIVDMLLYRYYDFWLNWHRTEMQLGNMKN